MVWDLEFIEDVSLLLVNWQMKNLGKICVTDKLPVGEIQVEIPVGNSSAGFLAVSFSGRT